MNQTESPIIEVESIVNRFGTHTVHDGINFSVSAGEIIALIGGSGSGKTTMLQTILMLLKPQSGSVKLFGQSVWDATPQEMLSIRRRIGVSFQYNALFSSLNVIENIRFPLDEFTHFSKHEKNQIARVKLQMVGLDPEIVHLLPAELSGGMQKRVSLARALVLEPDILFLDEPTSGLDPINARKFDKLVQNLREMLGLTIMMVTHDRHSLPVANRVLFLGEQKLLAQLPYKALIKEKHPLIQDYFAEELLSGE